MELIGNAIELILDGIGAHTWINRVYLICWRPLFSSRAVTNLIFFSLFFHKCATCSEFSVIWSVKGIHLDREQLQILFLKKTCFHLQVRNSSELPSDVKVPWEIHLYTSRLIEVNKVSQFWDQVQNGKMMVLLLDGICIVHTDELIFVIRSVSRHLFRAQPVLRYHLIYLSGRNTINLTYHPNHGIMKIWRKINRYKCTVPSLLSYTKLKHHFWYCCQCK